MKYRGPDDEGYFFHDNAALGMRRLSIIDVKGGHQPIYNETGTKCIIANGEIYNFKQLKQDLLLNKHRFTTNSDTEVILHLYEEYSVECLDKLNGMFAFAVYDREDGSLFIARDRLGVKPLYYYFFNGDFVFASELKAILEFPLVEKKIELEALNEYFTFECVPAPRTIYRNIQKLHQGHFLIYKDGQVRIEQYWNASFKEKVKYSDEECVLRLKDLIDDSVKLRLISDVPLGVFLSGGLDSSLITAFMARHAAHKIKTFNISFEDKSFDESGYATMASQCLGTEHYEQRLTAEKMLQILPKVIGFLDEPFADASIIPTYLLSKFTREKVTVALSGDGGDELFAGYPTYQAHRIAGAIPRFSYPLLNFIANRLPVSDDNISFDFKLKRILSGNSYPLPARHQIWLGSFTPEEKKELFLNDIYKQLKVGSDFDIVNYYQNRCDAENSLDRILYQDLQLYLQDNMLVKVDRASMVSSLEVRTPYLDYRIVEFAASLPSRLKLHLLTTKYILKRLARGVLPEKIVSRPKKGFGIPVAKWLKCELREVMHDLLSGERIKREGFFNVSYINRLIEEHLSNKKDNRKLLWTLLVFEMWFNKHELNG